MTLATGAQYSKAALIRKLETDRQPLRTEHVQGSARDPAVCIHQLKFTHPLEEERQDDACFHT